MVVSDFETRRCDQRPEWSGLADEQNSNSRGDWLLSRAIPVKFVAVAAGRLGESFSGNTQ
ncbi:MAG: hypothetical protein O3A00_11785 [Planctomycetota bacterium]|nr:hypothetical protein [Planctomycetota bacterium]